MARLPYLTTDDIAEEHHKLLARDINLNRLLVHNPGGARAFSRLGGWIRFDQSLDPRLRELAILQVGWCARSAYEWSHHVKLGLEFGVTDEDIDAIAALDRGESTHLAELDLAVLAAAREMADDIGVADATWVKLNEHMDTEQVMDLVMAIGFYCMVVRVLQTLQIDVEPDYEVYLERHPLPER
ncbi:MAG: carboxymuconolactone decarboxylase family protein [Acidimicrobiales bacterium]|jgi:alkylhydroperoxidase family enzyme